MSCMEEIWFKKKKINNNKTTWFLVPERQFKVSPDVENIKYLYNTEGGEKDSLKMLSLPT